MKNVIFPILLSSQSSYWLCFIICQLWLPIRISFYAVSQVLPIWWLCQWVLCNSKIWYLAMFYRNATRPHFWNMMTQILKLKKFFTLISKAERDLNHSMYCWSYSFRYYKNIFAHFIQWPFQHVQLVQKKKMFLFSKWNLQVL